MNPTNATLRAPFYGVLQAHGTIALHVDPPMDQDAERMVCAATQPSAVSFTIYSPNTIVVANRGVTPIGYLMMIVPQTFGPNESMLKTIGEQVKRFVQPYLNKLRGG